MFFASDGTRYWIDDECTRLPAYDVPLRKTKSENKVAVSIQQNISTFTVLVHFHLLTFGTLCLRLLLKNTNKGYLNVTLHTVMHHVVPSPVATAGALLPIDVLCVAEFFPSVGTL